tara:strand:+ start:87 stop:332 length:246 start_codon:yes stop_codon:yes gene_type:complete
MGKIKAGLRAARSKKPYEKAEANIEEWSKASKAGAKEYVEEVKRRGSMMPDNWLTKRTVDARYSGTRVKLGAAAPKRKRGK